MKNNNSSSIRSCVWLLGIIILSFRTIAPKQICSGKSFIDNLKLIYHVANIGDARPLAIHPASTTHSQLSETDQLKTGVTPGYVRLAVGLEHIDDILEDVTQALDNIELQTTKVAWLSYFESYETVFPSLLIEELVEYSLLWNIFVFNILSFTDKFEWGIWNLLCTNHLGQQ